MCVFKQNPAAIATFGFLKESSLELQFRTEAGMQEKRCNDHCVKEVSNFICLLAVVSVSIQRLPNG